MGQGRSITLTSGTNWTPDPTVKLKRHGLLGGHPVAVGKLTLDTPLPISIRAALQNPTKLGLKTDQTINVEDA